MNGTPGITRRAAWAASKPGAIPNSSAEATRRACRVIVPPQERERHDSVLTTRPVARDALRPLVRRVQSPDALEIFASTGLPGVAALLIQDRRSRGVMGNAPAIGVGHPQVVAPPRVPTVAGLPVECGRSRRVPGNTE